MLQGFVAAAEARGYQLLPVTNRYREQVCLQRSRHRYPFAVIEVLDRIPHEPTAAARAVQKDSWFYGIPEYDYHPSGRLALDLRQYYVGRDSRGWRRHWSYGRRSSLEDQVDLVLAELDERVVLDGARRVEGQR